ncbi:MAG: hypothetical protein ACLPN2_21485 [Terriglobales bacterium]
MIDLISVSAERALVQPTASAILDNSSPADVIAWGIARANAGVMG